MKQNTIGEYKRLPSSQIESSTFLFLFIIFSFGPLVWRSSKERRKTKSHRRDKCNSGDSGIQVELENDENLSENVHHNMVSGAASHIASRVSRTCCFQDISPQPTVKVRRANSAKVSTTSSIKSSGSGNSSHQRAHNNEPKSCSIASSINAKRSLSQPSDLDVIVCESAMMMMSNLDNIKHIDDDDEDEGSDTDSLASNQVEEIEDDGCASAVYAEVLYQFHAGGAQELSLEKGTLVEILRRETGPWWWGRVKYDAIIGGSEALEVREGWFPKDFVKIIPTFGGKTNKMTSQASSSIEEHEQQQHQQQHNCDITINNHLPPTSAAPSISSSQSSNEIMRDNVIKELLETEINYVKLLNSLVEG